MSFLCQLHLTAPPPAPPPPKTQRSQATTPATAAQLVDQRCQDTRAAGTNGVTKRDGTAIHVDSRPIPVQFFAICQRLGGKSFVDLDEVEIIHFQAGAL